MVVGAHEPPHASDEIRGGRFEDEVIMVRLGKERSNLESGLLAVFAHGLGAESVIGVVWDDEFATVAADHGMVERCGEFHL